VSVFPYITLCKMKPPSRVAFEAILFLRVILQTCLKDAAYEIHLHLDYWFTRRRGLHLFPYIILCKMKRPLVRPFWADFIFMHKLYKPCPKDVVCQISEYLDCSSWEEDLQTFIQFYFFLPLIGPQKVPALDFRTGESPFPKNASYKIWFKSDQRFRRSRRLKEKFAYGRTGHEQYSSLEHSAQVS